MGPKARRHSAQGMCRAAFALAVCLTLSTLIVAASAPLAAPLTFYSVADATTAAAQPDTPLGGGSTLVVGRGPTSGAAESYAYLTFDLSTIPGNAAVSSALLVLYLAGSTAQIPPVVRVHAVEQAWDEAKIQWDAQPQPGNEVI